MYMTWGDFFLCATFMLALVEFVIEHMNKKR